MPQSERSLLIRFIGDSKSLEQASGRANQAVDQVGVNLGQIAKTGLMLGVTREMVDFGREAVAASSDLAEATTKNQRIFEAQADDVLKWAQGADTAMGMSTRAALDASGTFAILAQAAKMSGEETAAFSKEQTQLAADFASFFNTKPEEAVVAIGAAYRGESEPIRRYGIMLNEATLKARAMTLGIYDGTGALTQQQRVMAVHAEIMAQSTKAQGDFARTSDGLANQQRIVAAQMENLKASMGNALLPVITMLTSGVSTLVDGFTSLSSTSQHLITLLGLVGGGGLVAIKAFLGIKDALVAVGVSASSVAPWLMGVLAAVTAIVAIIEIFSDKTDESAKRQQDLADAARMAADSIDIQTLALLDNVDAANQYKDAIFADHDQKIRDWITGNDAMMEAIAHYGWSIEDIIVASRDAASAQEWMNEAMGAGSDYQRIGFQESWRYNQQISALRSNMLGFGQDMDAVTHSQVLAARAGDLTAISYLKASGNMGLLTEAERAKAEAALDAASADEKQAAAQQAAALSAQDETRAQEEATKAKQAVEKATRDLTSAILAQYDTGWRLADAQDRLTEAMANLATTADDTKTPVDEHAQAERDAEQAALAAAVAYRDQQKALAEAAGTPLTAAQENQILIDSLSMLAGSMAPDSPVRAAIMGMISDLQAIPTDTSVNVGVTVTGADDAINTFDRMGGKIKEIDTDARVGTDAPDAKTTEQAVDDVTDAISDLIALTPIKIDLTLTGYTLTMSQLQALINRLQTVINKANEADRAVARVAG